MIKYLTVFIAALLAGCTTGISADSQIQQASSEAVRSDAAGPEDARAPAALPVELSLSGQDAEDGIDVTMRIAYHIPVHADTRIIVVPGDGTRLIRGNAEETVASPQQPGVVVRTIRIGGENPSVLVTAVVQDAGFSAETHAAFPPPKVPHRQDVALTPLPAPIEVEGSVIESGVEVRP